MADTPALCREDKHGPVKLTAASTFINSGGHISIKGTCEECGLTRSAVLDDQKIAVLLNAIIQESPAITCTLPTPKSGSEEYTPLCACG